jgi:hypothetical protein
MQKTLKGNKRYGGTQNMGCLIPIIFIFTLAVLTNLIK